MLHTEQEVKKIRKFLKANIGAVITAYPVGNNIYRRIPVRQQLTTLIVNKVGTTIVTCNIDDKWKREVKFNIDGSYDKYNSGYSIVIDDICMYDTLSVLKEKIERKLKGKHDHSTLARIAEELGIEYKRLER